MQGWRQVPFLPWILKIKTYLYLNVWHWRWWKKEIKQLIQDSVSRVQDGSALVEVSRKTINQMVQEILQVANMVGDIVVTTKEQASGVGQINTAILQMDQITQQNAALVEEASAASETMADQARALDQLMGFFKR